MDSILLIVTVLGLIVAVRFIKDFLSKDKFEKQREKEFKENVTVGATNEPHVLRYLDEFERKILIDENKAEYKVVQLSHYIAPLFAIAFLALAYFVYKDWDLIKNDSDYLLEIIVKPVLMVAGILSILYYKYVRENNLDKDLRSPVFAVRGELLKKEVRRRNSVSNSFFVRGVEFKDRENPQIDLFWKDWGEGAMVNVEYSPFTKHIWKIEKV